MSEKLKLALYWAASCGGCDITVLDLQERILDVVAAADIVFWPVALDFKYADVERMPNKSIDVCLFNGAVRTGENEHIARLLRAKSKVLVAFGSCAYSGGVPGLANLTDRQGIFQRVYHDTPSTANPEGVVPQTSWETPVGTLHLPEIYDSVRSLNQVVPVDYYQPGCPPVPDQVWNVVQAIVSGNLPPAGSVVGANQKALCDECTRTKSAKKVKRFYRPFEIEPDPEKCLLEQGIVCCGPATRGGCGTPCIKANMPCRGCYGPPAGTADQGAKLLSAIASVVDSQDEKEIRSILAGVVDPVGTFYRFGLPASTLFRRNLGRERTVAG